MLQLLYDVALKTYVETPRYCNLHLTIYILEPTTRYIEPKYILS